MGWYVCLIVIMTYWQSLDEMMLQSDESRNIDRSMFGSNDFDGNAYDDESMTLEGQDGDRYILHSTLVANKAIEEAKREKKKSFFSKLIMKKLMIP